MRRACSVPHTRSRVLQATSVRGWGREHAASGRLGIGLADGTRREIEVIEALGSPNRAMSDQALVEKFTNCGARAAHPLATATSATVAEIILRGSPELPVAAMFNSLSGHGSPPTDNRRAENIRSG